MSEDIKPGTEGRPAGCFYFKEDHERAAEHVREKAPEVYKWIKANPDGLPDDLSMHQLMWRTAMELLPKASLIDHAKVALLLRLHANPLSDEDREKIDRMIRRSKERARMRRH